MHSCYNEFRKARFDGEKVSKLSQNFFTCCKIHLSSVHLYSQYVPTKYLLKYGLSESLEYRIYGIYYVLTIISINCFFYG